MNRKSCLLAVLVLAFFAGQSPAQIVIQGLPQPNGKPPAAKDLEAELNRRLTEAFQQAGAVHDLKGHYALGEVCERIDSLDFFPEPPQRDVSRLYRRWTFHSAALDLALRQNDKQLGEELGLRPRPMTFVASLRGIAPLQIDGLASSTSS